MIPEIENQIRNGILWNKLPSNLKLLIGNSQKEYEKLIVVYCIRNQARFKDTLVRYVRKDEKKYYEEMLQYSKEHYMLYPYHLSDIFVKGLRITPFNYYLDMMSSLMMTERNYDTLPNFTAIDCVRLLGIGRNQYIDIMNRYRSSSRILLGFSRRKPITSLLPTQPVKILIEPWWLVNVGCITEDDVKGLSNEEKKMIDRLIDNDKPIEAGTLSYDIVHLLYRKGLIYLDVPLQENDYVEVPPLEGFVMNRIVGDYFETLLYKIFVSIDDRTSLNELASLLEIDIELVLNAVSVYCRLSFAKKKSNNNSLEEEKEIDPSWKDYKYKYKKPGKSGESLLEWSTSQTNSSSTDNLKNNNNNNNNDNNLSSDTKLSLNLDELNLNLPISSKSSSKSQTPNLLTPTEDKSNLNVLSHGLMISPQTNQTNNVKRIAFLFDSTLTAFLMMGNLSLGLKNHAVTMFEVGKLTDHSMDNFLAELEKVSNEQNEGEAQRYFDHAKILKLTIQFLRYNNELSIFSGFRPKPTADAAVNNESATNNDTRSQIPIEKEPVGLDLLRCESLASLDEESKQRLLAKNYSILFSMAPYSNSGEFSNSPPITCNMPYHFGPAIPEMNSVWFKLYLYELVGNSPGCILIPQRYGLKSLPISFNSFSRFVVTSWGHDSVISTHTNVLNILKTIAIHSPILIECYSYDDKQGCTINISFNDTKHPLFEHPAVKKLHEKLDLENFVGYITLLNQSNYIVDIDQADTINFNEWKFYELRFGIPLFDNKLNTDILRIFKEKNLGSYESLNKMVQSNRRLSLELLDFIQKYQSINIFDKNFFEIPNRKENNSSNHHHNHHQHNQSGTTNLSSNKYKKMNQQIVTIKPTQCILFENNKIEIVKENLIKNKKIIQNNNFN